MRWSLATGTRGHRDENRGRSSAGDRGRITKNRKICGTAVSKLPRARAEPANCVSEGGRAARGGWPGFPLRRVVGGFLRSSKEGERCKEGENLLESSKEGKEGEKQRQPPRTSELGARQ